MIILQPRLLRARILGESAHIRKLQRRTVGYYEARIFHFGGSRASVIRRLRLHAARPSGSLLSEPKVKVVNTSGQPMALPPSPVYSGVAPPTGVLLLVAYSHSSQVNEAGPKTVSPEARLANGRAAASSQRQQYVLTVV